MITGKFTFIIEGLGEKSEHRLKNLAFYSSVNFYHTISSDFTTTVISLFINY